MQVKPRHQEKRRTHPLGIEHKVRHMVWNIKGGISLEDPNVKRWVIVRIIL